VNPTKGGDDLDRVFTRKHEWDISILPGAFMYKFMFFAFVLSAVYPNWPNDAVDGGQKMIVDFQSRTILLDQELPE